LATFIVGGALGGGIAAATVPLHSKSDNNSSTTRTTTVDPITVTQTVAPTATATVAVNAAGCPLSNDTTFTSLTGSRYGVLCDYDITSGTNLVTDGINENSLDNCLDACTTYNQNTTATAITGECKGATWVILAPSAPTLNGLCFFKGSSIATALDTSLPAASTVACGYLM